MFRLQFTEFVLGPWASRKLKDKAVNQTLRSKNSDIVQAIFSGELRQGDILEISLNNIALGTAKLLGCFEANSNNLTEDDAIKGGFLSLKDLRAAIIRAGFRFKQSYDLYRVQFEWVQQGA